MFGLFKRKETVSKADFIGEGWVYWSPDTGEEFASQHPVESGEVPDATHIRQATEMEASLNAGLQYWFSLATRLEAENKELRAQHERRLAPLMAANAARKAAAQAKQA